MRSTICLLSKIEPLLPVVPVVLLLVELEHEAKEVVLIIVTSFEHVLAVARRDPSDENATEEGNLAPVDKK
jgi:hypothetical protein